MPRLVSLLITLVHIGTASVSAETIPPSEFKVAEGFEIQVWATTPQLHNPTNFDVDAKGRMWVTQSVNYRNFRNEALGLSDQGGDSVVVLEDTDLDGTADSSHLFVQDPDLVAPLGIAVVDNKVVVSCAPNILIYTDVNRDARFDANVDKKEVFLTGFRGFDHDHSLHSVKVGPDGYWYFNVGNAGAHTVTDKSGWTLRAGSSYAGGSPHLTENTPGRKSDDGRVWVGGVAMRIRPDGTGLEPIGYNFRNVYEESVTSFGDVFHADNDDPPACRTTWLMEYGNAGFASADGSRSWQVDQRPGQTVGVAEWRQDDPGTIPAGDVYGYGAPTGVAFGENGCFDNKYPNGLLLVCESARGELFGYEPKPQGAGFSLERFEFLKLKSGSSKQGWFRPSDVAVGVDGAIYVSDWYDPGVGGHRMSDETGSGTIYRIAPNSFQPQIPEIDITTSEGQITALSSPATNVRSLGWNALQEQGADALPAIRKVLKHDNSHVAARGLWLLPYTGDDGLKELESYLRDGTPTTRMTAFRALRRAANDPTHKKRLSARLLNAQQELSSDRSPAVRREVALSIRDLPWETRKDILKTIEEKFDGWDPWYLEAIGISADAQTSEAYKLLVEDIGVTPLMWDRRLAGLAWRLHPVESVPALTERVLAKDLPFKERKRMLTALAFIPDQEAAESMLLIANDGPEDMKGIAAWWGKNRDSNDWGEFNLGKEFPEPPPIKKPPKWFTPRLDFELAGEPAFEAVGTNVEINLDIKGAKRLYLVVEQVSKESEQNPKGKSAQTHKSVSVAWQNAQLLTKDKTANLTERDWLLAFGNGQAVGLGNPPIKGKWDRRIKLNLPEIPNGDNNSLHVQTRSVIAYDLSDAAYSAFRTTGEVEAIDGKQEVVRFMIYLDHSPSGKELPPAIELVDMTGDPSHGRALFFSKQLACSNCHSASGFGGKIGPDLTQIAKKHARPILFDHILKPSAAISTGFETLSVITVQGKVYSGLIVSAGDPIVLKDANNKNHTIPRGDVEEMLSSKLSMMPDLTKQLTAEELASIISFLQSMELQ